MLGAGGHAKVVISALTAMGKTVGGAFSDVESERGATVLGIPVIGPLRSIREHGLERAVIAIGDNGVRQRIASELEYLWMPVVHPRAWVHASSVVGEGAVLMAGAIVQPEAAIGAHAIVNTGATIDHDCIVAAFAHVCPGAHLAGGVLVGEGVLLGAGCTVIPGVRIGAGAIVGAGSTVIRDVDEGITVVGSPAKEVA